MDLNDLLQQELDGTAPQQPATQPAAAPDAASSVSDDELDALLGTMRGVPPLTQLFPDVDPEELSALAEEAETGAPGFFETAFDLGMEDVPFLGDVASAYDLYDDFEAQEAWFEDKATPEQQRRVAEQFVRRARGTSMLGQAGELAAGAVTFGTEMVAVAATGGAALGAVAGKKATAKGIGTMARKASRDVLERKVSQKLARTASKRLGQVAAVATRAAGVGLGVTAAKEAIPRLKYGVGAANATSFRRVFNELTESEARDLSTLVNEANADLLSGDAPMSWKGLAEVFMINSLEVAGAPAIRGVAGATLGKIPPAAYLSALSAKAIDRGLAKLPGKGRTFSRIQRFLRDRASFHGELEEVAEELLQNTITEETFGNDWRDGLPEDFEELAAMFVGFGALPTGGFAIGTSVDAAAALQNRFTQQARIRREQRKIPLAEGLSDQPDPTQQAPRDVTPEEYATFVATGEVSDETVAAIADQVMEGGARRREQEEFGAGVAYDTPDPRVQAFMGDAAVAARVEEELLRRAEQLEAEPAFEAEVNQAAQAFGAAIGAAEEAQVTVSATPRAMPDIGDRSPEAEQERERSQLGYAASMLAQRLGRRLVFVDTNAARRDGAPRAAFDDATGVMFVDAAVENPLEAVVHEAQHSAFLRTRVADPEMQAQQMDYLRSNYSQQWSEAERLYQSRNPQYSELDAADYEEEVAATMAEELFQEIVQAVFSDAQSEQTFRRLLTDTIEEANQSPAGRGFWGRMLEALRNVAAALRLAPPQGQMRKALAEVLGTDPASAEEQARLIMDLVSLLEGTVSGAAELFEDEAGRLRFAPPQAERQQPQPQVEAAVPKLRPAVPVAASPAGFEQYKSGRARFDNGPMSAHAPMTVSTAMATGAKFGDKRLRRRLMPSVAGYDNVQKATVARYLALTPFASRAAGKSDTQVINEAVRVFKANALMFFDAYPAELRDRATQWYPGGNRLCEQIGKDFNVSTASAVAVMAAHSPQTEWMVNVERARQTVQVYTQHSNERLTPEMVEWAQGVTTLRNKKTVYLYTETGVLDAIKDKTLLQLMEEAEQAEAEARALPTAKARNRALADVKHWQWRNAGLWVRAFAHSALRKDYTLYDPEAQAIDLMRDKQGNVRRMGFMGTTPISKSLRILRGNGALEVIDEELGQGNKVRSFYMNLLHPYDGQGEVTNDTHNISALAMMPVGSSAELVAQGLAGSTKEFEGKGKAKRKQRIWARSGVKHFGTGAPVSGMQGLYPVFADALREAAAARNVIPREMQSIVWEAVRGLMENRKTAARQSESDAIWDNYAERRISLTEAQRQLFALYPGIDYPAWAERDLRVVDLNGTIVSTADTSGAELAGAGDRRGAVPSGGAPVVGGTVRGVPAGRRDAAEASQRRRARGSRSKLKFAPARTLRSAGYEATPLTAEQLEQSQAAYDEQSVLEHRSASVARLALPKADVRRLAQVTDAEVSFADLPVNDEPARVRVVVAPDGEPFVVGNVLEAIGDPELLANFNDMALETAATEYTAQQLESVADQMATHPDIVRLRGVNNETQSSTLDDAGGEFTEEWQRSRDWAGIVEDLYTDTEDAKAAATGGAPKKERKALIIAGGSASGKSTIAAGDAERMGALIVDSDFAKERLPEFDGGNGAGRVHLESKAINKLLLARALTAGDNVVMPVVGSSGSSISKTIGLLKKMGYTVGFKFIDVPKEVAAARNFQRIYRTGRFIDPAYVDKQYESIAQNWPRGQAEADLAARLTNENQVKEYLEQKGDWDSFGSEEDLGGVDAGGRPLRGADDRGAAQRARTSASDVEVSIDWYGGAERGQGGWTADAVAVKSLGPDAVVGERRQRQAPPIRRRRMQGLQLTPNDLVQSMARDMLRRGESLPPFSDVASTGLAPQQPSDAAAVTASGTRAPEVKGESTLQEGAPERRPQEVEEQREVMEASPGVGPADATRPRRPRQGRARMLELRERRRAEGRLYGGDPAADLTERIEAADVAFEEGGMRNDAGFGAGVTEPVRIGNANLNNPGNTAETRALWDVVDRDRAVRGGQVIGREDAERRARQALQDDYVGTRLQLEQKLSSGEPLDTYEHRALVNVINDLFTQSLNPQLSESERREALHDGRELGYAYREMRAEIARRLGAPVGLGMTAKEQVIVLMMQLPITEVRRRERVMAELSSYLRKSAPGSDPAQYVQTFFGRRQEQGSEYDMRNAPQVNERGQLISQERLDYLLAEKRKIEELDEERQDRAMRALQKAGYDAFVIEDPDALLDPVHGHLIRNTISSAKATWTEKAVELRQSNLVTGVQTHVVNITGNAAMLAVNGPAQKLVEGIVSAGLRAVGKDDPKMAYIREMVPYMMGGLRAVPEAVRNFFEAIRTEGPIFEMDLKRAGAEFGAYATKLDTQTGVKVAGFKGRAARFFSFAMLQAFDEMFKTIAGNMEASALAWRHAFREGLRGEALQRRMNELMDDKTHPLWTEALYFAREITLQDEGSEAARESAKLLGSLGEFLDRLTEWIVIPVGSIAGALGVKGATRDQNIALPAGLLLFPFRRVPLRLTAQALRRTPFGAAMPIHNIARGKYKGDKGLLVQDIADGFIALGLFMILLEALDDDDETGLPVITGSRPVSRGEAGAEFRTAPPMSVRIGDDYYSYGRIEPLGTSMGIAIDAVQQFRRTGSGDALATGAASLVGMLEDKTFLRSIGDLIVIMREYRGGNVTESEAAARFLRNLYVTPWVPNLIRQTARESAAEYQLPRSITEDGYAAFMVDGMFDSKGEPLATGLTGVAPSIKRDLWGRPIRRGQGEDGFGSDLLLRLINPMRHLRQVKDISPVDMALRTANERIRRQELPDVDPYFPTLPTRSYTVTVEQDGEEMREQRRMTSPQYEAFIRDAGQAAHAGLLQLLPQEARDAYEFSFTDDADADRLSVLAIDVADAVDKKLRRRDDWDGEFNWQDPGAAELAAIKAAKDAAYRMVRKELADRVTGQ